MVLNALGELREHFLPAGEKDEPMVLVVKPGERLFRLQQLLKEAVDLGKQLHPIVGLAGF
ncbi:hypothetical protein D3C73_1589830 [compost metagenome]